MQENSIFTIMTGGLPSVETCPDGHHCMNGSKCVENPMDETAYYCDCQESVFEARYEGLYCEHQADVYCIASGIHKHSFCTNGGECIEYVSSEEAHMGCKCPSDYEGSYCQYVKGTKPEGWPYTNDKPTLNVNTTSNMGNIIGTFVVIMVIGIILSALFYKNCLNGESEEYSGVTGEDLNLEADGSELKSQMQSQSKHGETDKERLMSSCDEEEADSEVQESDDATTHSIT